jgi:hypothetical protein
MGGVLALFATLGMGCRGCGSCGSCAPSEPLFSCEPLPFAPTDAPSFIIDGGMRPDVRLDAPFSTIDVRREACDYVTAGSNIGAYCGDGCASRLTCSLLEVEVDDAVRDLTPTFCTAACTLEDDTCGPCARCVASLPLGASRLELGTDDPLDGLCAARCVPSALDRGTCLPGFTCEWTARVCVPACASDADCALIEGEGGLFSALPEGAASCDVTSGRCRHPDPAEPLPPMALCTSDLECAASERCFHDPRWADEVSVCVELGCDLPALACDVGLSCVPLGEGAACQLDCLADAECPAHLRCDLDSNTCWRGCQTDLDCAASETCIAGDGGVCDGVACGCRARRIDDTDAGLDADAGRDADAGVPDESDGGDMDGGLDD